MLIWKHKFLWGLQPSVSKSGRLCHVPLKSPAHQYIEWRSDVKAQASLENWLRPSVLLDWCQNFCRIKLDESQGIGSCRITGTSPWIFWVYVKIMTRPFCFPQLLWRRVRSRVSILLCRNCKTASKRFLLFFSSLEDLTHTRNCTGTRFPVLT